MSSNFGESLFQKVSSRETARHLVSTSDLTDTHIQSRVRRRGGREGAREREERRKAKETNRQSNKRVSLYYCFPAGKFPINKRYFVCLEISARAKWT